jgi:hypothetical protein
MLSIIKRVRRKSDRRSISGLASRRVGPDRCKTEAIIANFTGADYRNGVQVTENVSEGDADCDGLLGLEVLFVPLMPETQRYGVKQNCNVGSSARAAFVIAIQPSVLTNTKRATVRRCRGTAAGRFIRNVALRSAWKAA